MKAKSHIALAALGVALGTVLIVTQVAWSDGEPQPLKLEGSWIAKGQIGQWMYSFSPSDPSGREAAFQGTIHVIDPTLGGLFPDVQYVTDLIGQAVVTSPGEAAYTVVEYAMKKVGAIPEKVVIIVDSGTVRRIAPGKAEVHHNIALYLPSQDADEDGLPDKGQSPILCLPFTSLDTRLPILPPCTPAPAP